MIAALLFALLSTPARAIPDNIWSHIQTACAVGQVPVRTSTTWTCGTPSATSVPAAGITAGTLPAGVFLPAQQLVGGPLPVSVLPSTVAYTTAANAFTKTQTFNGGLSASTAAFSGAISASSATFTYGLSAATATLSGGLRASSATLTYGLYAATATLTGAGVALTVQSTATISGQLNIGWELVSNACGAGVTTCTANCSANKVTLGGGCNGGGVALTGDFGTSTSWTCTSVALTTVTAYVYCARFGP